MAILKSNLINGNKPEFGNLEHIKFLKENSKETKDVNSFDYLLEGVNMLDFKEWWNKFGRADFYKWQKESYLTTVKAH